MTSRMAEVQMTADDNVSATGQQHTEQPEFINEGEVDQNAEQCHDICPLPAKLTDNRTTELIKFNYTSPENVLSQKDCGPSGNTSPLAKTKVESEPLNKVQMQISLTNMKANKLLNVSDSLSSSSNDFRNITVQNSKFTTTAIRKSRFKAGLPQKLSC
ncbi:hypothetical protein Tco_0707776 [Tanacetum coccineum]